MLVLPYSRAVKAGETQQAIKHYYNVILSLKGLNVSGLNDVITPKPSPNKSVTTPKISEISLADDEDAEKGPGEEKEEEEDTSDDKAESTEAEDPNDIYSGKAIKKTLAQCYVNMAICNAKKNAWAACKRNAEKYAAHSSRAKNVLYSHTTDQGSMLFVVH